MTEMEEALLNIQQMIDTLNDEVVNEMNSNIISDDVSTAVIMKNKIENFVKDLAKYTLENAKELKKIIDNNGWYE